MGIYSTENYSTYVNILQYILILFVLYNNGYVVYDMRSAFRG